MLEPHSHIGELFARRREELGLTQAALAKRMGTSQAYVARVEGAKRDPRWQTVLEFARALELEPALIPRESIPAVCAALALSDGAEVPPLTGGSW